MEKSQKPFYNISSSYPKPKNFTEIPDNYQNYFVISCNNMFSSPLSFILMFGYIHALSLNDSDLRKFINELRSNSIPELNPTPEVMNWLTIIPSQPTSWIKTLGANANLQKDIERILREGCHLDSRNKFEPIYLPMAANILKCDILYYQPYAYQKILIKPENVQGKFMIVIEMDYENLFKLFIKDEERGPRAGYLQKKMELKELIIKRLVNEQDDNYRILEKVALKVDIDAELVKDKLKNFEELDSLVDELIELKKSNGKKRGIDSNMVEYLIQIKKENANMERTIRLFRPAIQEEEEKDPIVVDDMKLPCMDCNDTEKKILELKCGHTICCDCLTSRINDGKSTKKPFVIKCSVSYCYYIITTNDISVLLGKSILKAVWSYNSSRNDSNCCLICQKKSNINLHDEHSLCNTCLLSYVNYSTDSDIVKVDPNTKSIIPINCPMNYLCKKTFSLDSYKNLVNDINQLIEKAWKRVGIMEDEEKEDIKVINKFNADIKDQVIKEEEEPDEEMSPVKPNEKMAKCYKCKTTEGLARLHNECEIFFCKNDGKELGKNLVRNKSIFMFNLEICLYCNKPVQMAILSMIQLQKVEYSNDPSIFHLIMHSNTRIRSQH